MKFTERCNASNIYAYEGWVKGTVQQLCVRRIGHAPPHSNQHWQWVEREEPKPRERGKFRSENPDISEHE